MKPSGIKDLKEPKECSICKSDKVFYTDLFIYQDGVVEFLGIELESIQYGLRCYCLECFEEYGGMNA